MSAELVGIVSEVIGNAIADCAQLREGIGGPATAEVIQRYADAARDAWEEARIIHTAAGLGVLPDGAVVRDRDTAILTKDGSWLEPGGGDLYPTLPALLIWHPDWSQS